MPPETEVLLQLAKGLEHIHKNGLVHRKIKPSTVLIRLDSTTQRVMMKWASFGFSKQVNERGTFTMSGVKGTFNWFAPEILTFLNEEGSTESEAQNRGAVKSDVFAEGLVFGYFISGGVHPFGTTSHQIQINVRTNEPVNLPSKLYEKPIKIFLMNININFVKREFAVVFREEMGNVCNIITEMLEKEPRNRITSSDVVKRLMQITEKKVLKLCLNYYLIFTSLFHF
jgi:serine/threonine-protein kinase/endoribonuclease IRE1